MPWEWNGPASPPTNNVHSDQLRFGVTCLWLQKPELKMRPELCFVTETCDWPFELSLWLYIGITAPVNLRIHAEYITTKIVALLRDIWLFKRIFLPIDQLHRTSNRTEACTPTCITCSVTSFYFLVFMNLLTWVLLLKCSLAVSQCWVCVHVSLVQIKKRSWSHHVNITCVPPPSVNHRVPISPDGPRCSPAALCWDLHHHPALCSGGGGLPCLQVRAHTHTHTHIHTHSFSLLNTSEI